VYRHPFIRSEGAVCRTAAAETLITAHMRLLIDATTPSAGVRATCASLPGLFPTAQVLERNARQWEWRDKPGGNERKSGSQ
jgi:hypothetical protein